MIKIIEKHQGKMMWRLTDEPWQKLMELDGGVFSETETSIDFSTTSKNSITADKKNVYENTNEKITYWGSMNSIGGPQILVDKIKNEQGHYVLRSFYPDSFIIVLSHDGDKKVSQNNDTNIGLSMFQCKLNGQQLALLYISLSKGLFSKPLKSKIFSKCGLPDGSCIIYFEMNYYHELVSSIETAQRNGKFDESNASNDWYNLMHTINGATKTLVDKPDELETYPVWGEE